MINNLPGLFIAGAFISALLVIYADRVEMRAFFVLVLAALFGVGMTGFVAGYATRLEMPSPVVVWAALGEFTVAQELDQHEPRMYRYRLSDAMQGLPPGTVIRRDEEYRDGGGDKWRIAPPERVEKQ